MTVYNQQRKENLRKYIFPSFNFLLLFNNMATSDTLLHQFSIFGSQQDFHICKSQLATTAVQKSQLLGSLNFLKNIFC